MEYAAEGSYAPIIGLRDGKWKYSDCRLDPEQLFDLDADPYELHNLADSPVHRETMDYFRQIAVEIWDMDRFDKGVRSSQARRWVVYETLRQG